eukprot:1832844-Pyramimonas_sp.AAC.1
MSPLAQSRTSGTSPICDVASAVRNIPDCSKGMGNVMLLRSYPSHSQYGDAPDRRRGFASRRHPRQSNLRRGRPRLFYGHG